MSQKFEKLIEKTGSEYKLSDGERAKMSRVVREYMQFKPIVKPLREAPTYSISVSSSWFSFAHRPLAAALVLVLVFGSGVSYAAENALPGDALYSIKTYVNEPSRLALASGAEAKAEIQIEFAERRIEEATILAAEGRLDENTEGELAVAFESHAASAAEHMTAADEDDSSTSVELASRFETRLVAHENILAEVEAGREEDDAPHTMRLADAIRAASENVISIRAGDATLAAGIADVAIDASVAADAEMRGEPAAMMMSLAAPDAPAETTTNSRTAKFVAEVAPAVPAPAPDAKKIARMKSGAEKSLKNAQKTLRSAKSLSAEAKERAEADLTFADSLLTEGSEHLEADADADTFAAFEESLRISEQTAVYLKAAPMLEKARSRGKSSRTNIENGVESRTENDIDISASEVGASVNVGLDTTVTNPTPADEPKKEDESNEHKDEDESSDTKVKLELSL